MREETGPSHRVPQMDGKSGLPVVPCLMATAVAPLTHLSTAL